MGDCSVNLLGRGIVSKRRDCFIGEEVRAFVDYNDAPREKKPTIGVGTRFKIGVLSREH